MSVIRGFGLLGLLVVVLVAGLVLSVLLALDRQDAAAGAHAEAVESYNATVPSATTAPAPTVTVISDEFTAPSRTVTPVPVWPQLAEEDLQQRIVVLGSPGAGYTVPPLENEFGGTFSAIANEVSPSSRLVVFFGGTNDLRARSTTLRTSAEAAFDAAKAAAPGAQLLVIGPATTNDDPPADLIRVRDVLQQAAEAKGARFVDPIAAGWLTSSAGMVRLDQVSLSAKAQETLAARIEPLITDELQ